MANQYTKAHQTAEEVHAVLSRVSSLETGLDSLSSDVRSLAHSLEGFAAETRTAIGQLSQKMADGQKTPWGVVFAGLGVLLTVLSLVGGLVAYGIQKDIQHVQELQSQRLLLTTVPLRANLEALEAKVLPRIKDRWYRSDQQRFEDRLEKILLRVDSRIHKLEYSGREK